MNTTKRYQLLNRLLNWATRLSQFAIWGAGGLTLISALYITADILARNILGFPLGGRR